ncbi:response regulator [uncultured Brevundimonas sp.]|uniref:response regulator n=1 Tax=uncultured Brevundimonas sp. TaxID=213418 RepID=UPI0030EDFE5F
MNPGLNGRRVLIVEDESLVAMLLETILEDMGCVPVGPASTIEEGLAMAGDESTLDAALLDVNVAGQQVFPVADLLKARGVPFIFSTGYGEGGLPDEWRGQSTIQKPFTEAAIRDALMKAMGVSAV